MENASLIASSSDIPLEKSLIFPALEIFEGLNKFSKTLRLSNFTFELFCISLDSNDSINLLTECHKSLLRCIMRDNDKNNVTFSEHKDCKDTLSIFFMCVDYLTFFEVLNIYFQAIRKQLPHQTNEKLKIIFVKQVYNELTAKEKIFLLKLLLDAFITSDLIREELDKEEVYVHEDHCRACHKRGDLLCCESCSATFHHYCLESPLSKFPDGDWFCIACTMHQDLARKQKNKLPNKDKVADGVMMKKEQKALGIDAALRTYWFIADRIFVEKNGKLEGYYSTEDKLDELMIYLQHDHKNEALVNQLKQKHPEILKSMSMLAERMTEIQSYVMTEGGLEEYLDNAYCNVYTVEILALSKQQQIEEKERKRYLSYKFSMAGFNDFSWIGDANRANFLSKVREMPKEECEARLEHCKEGGLDSTIKLLQNTLIHLKDCIPKAFFHANWLQHSERWSKAVRLCTKAREFSLALLILNSSIKPFIFHDAWIKATGHLGLEIRSMEEREEEKKMEQELKFLLKEDLNNHSLMKNPIGFRHQLWKQRGEEYRMLGRYAWMWLSPTRRSQCGSSRFKKSFIYNSINKNNNFNDDIDTEVIKSKIKSKLCIFMEGLLEKAVELNNELVKKKRDIEIKLVLLKNLNGVCNNLFEESEDLKEKLLKEDENTDLMTASNGNDKIKLDDIYCSFTSFLNHLERFQKSDKNNAQKRSLKQKMLAAEHSLKQYNLLKPHYLVHSVNLGKYLNVSKVNEAIKQGGLPKSHKFQIGRHKKLMSVYVLERKKKKKLSRRAGGVEVAGYVYNQLNFCAYKHVLQNWKFEPPSTIKEETKTTASIAVANEDKTIKNSLKIPSTVLSLSCTPRLTLANSWTYKLTKGVTLSGFAMHMRVMWASIRWEEMYQEYPPMGLLQTEDAVENTTTTCKLIKRRILTPKFDPVNYKVEYLVQKNTKLNDTENSTLNSSYGTGRQGLRERKVHEAVVCKEWMPEEALELWQIRYFNSVWERQNNAKMPYSPLTSNNTSQMNTCNNTSRTNNMSMSDERSEACKSSEKLVPHLVSNASQPQDTLFVSPPSECPSSPPPLSPPAPLVYPLLTSALSSSSSSLPDPSKDSQFNSILSNNRGSYYSRKRCNVSKSSTEVQTKKAKPQTDGVINIENHEMPCDVSKPSDSQKESIIKGIIDAHTSQGNKTVKIYSRSGGNIHALCLRECVSDLNGSCNSLALKSYKAKQFKSKCKSLVSVFSSTNGKFDVNYLSHLLANFCKSNSVCIDFNFNKPDGISLTIKANNNVSFQGSETDEITLNFNKCIFKDRIYKTFSRCGSTKNYISRQTKRQHLSIKYGSSTYIPQRTNPQSTNSNNTTHLNDTCETSKHPIKQVLTKREINLKNNLEKNQQKTMTCIDDNDKSVYKGESLVLSNGKHKRSRYNSNIMLQASNEDSKKEETSSQCNGFHKPGIEDDKNNEIDNFNDDGKNNKENFKELPEGKDKEKLYCICNTPYDATKFYVGCSICERWMHGSCVDLTPEEACKIDVYVCDKCHKDKEEMDDEKENKSEMTGDTFENDDDYDFIDGEEKKDGLENEEEEEVFCVCLTPYDQTRFYIGCDGCQGWFHGECMHISAEDASKLTSFYCPSCR